MNEWFEIVLLSHQADLLFAIMSLMLMISYILWGFIYKGFPEISPNVRRIRFFTKAMNWGIFGLVFLLFEIISTQFGLLTWRATARIALFFLMFSELAFELGTSQLLYREMKKCKLIQSFLSLLQ